MIEIALPLMIAMSAQAQASPHFPVIDHMAASLVQKYQTSSCAQLAQERQAPPNPQQEALKDRVGQQLQRDPQMRAALVGKVAAPVVDKMIVCGFIP